MSATKIIAIIQARLGSSRLPLKSLLSLKGLPIINWVIDRLSRAKLLSGLIVAIPDTIEDQVLADHLSSCSIPWMAGPENDVLARYVMAAEKTKADLVVRICADNPLIWWTAVDSLISFYLQSKPDYAYNHIPRGNLWPDGLGAEILSADLLREISVRAKRPEQREHCLNYIWDNPSQFNIATFNPKEKYLRKPELKLDIDRKEDYLAIASKNISPDSSAEEIVREFTLN